MNGAGDDRDGVGVAPDFGVAPAGESLPPALRLGRVRLQVGDLERSLAFYRRLLGMRVERELDGALLGTGVTEDSGEVGEPLLELRERQGASPAPRQGRLGLYHFALLLPLRSALGRFVAHLDAAGVRFGAADHLVSESIYLRDPDGLGIEVYADRPRSEWRSDGRELVMATRPLDLAAVVRDGGGEPWRGLPPGTVIGHLHLHVADLGAAAGFYHAALGLWKTVWTYPGALFLAAPGYHHHLGLNTWAADPTPPPADQARLLDWEVRLGDAAALGRAIGRLEAAGYSVETGARGRAGEVGLARDPWGTALRMVAAVGQP